MRTLSPAELKKDLHPAVIDKGLKLYRENRVYKPVPKDEGWTVMVIAEAPLPFDLEFIDQKSRIQWSCSCGSDHLCQHFWAFAIRLYKEEKLYNGNLRSVIGRSLDPGGQSQQRLNPGKTEETGLFNEGLFQPSLFDDHPPQTKQSPAPLNPATGGNPYETSSFSEIPSRDPQEKGPGLFDPGLGRTEIPGAIRGSGRDNRDFAKRRDVRAIILRRPSLTRPDIYVEPSYIKTQKDSLAGDLEYPDESLAMVKDIADSVEAGGLPALGLSFCAEAVLRLYHTEPGLLRASQSGLGVHIRRLRAIHVEAHFAKVTAEGRATYGLKLRCSSLAYIQTAAGTEHEVSETLGLPSIQTEGDVVYFGNPESLVLSSGNETVSRFVRQLKSMPALLTGLELEQIRRGLEQRESQLADGSQTGREGQNETGSIPVSIDVPSEERFEYVDTRPLPVVRFQASGERTDIFVLFSYDGVETRLHNGTEILSKILSDGTTLMYRRHPEDEKAFLSTLREVVAPHIAYESGLYAGLLVERHVADLNLKLTGANFVTELGPLLMEAGFELRTEGKPVRSRASVSFRAQSELDWFGFRAGWRPDSSSWIDSASTADKDYAAAQDTEASHSMRLDQNLERYGMALAGEGDDNYWIVFAKRDIDKLKLLQRMGMDADGVLESSPVNVSLIDTLYNQIENQSEEHIVRARELGRHLAGFTKTGTGSDASYAGHKSGDGSEDNGSGAKDHVDGDGSPPHLAGTEAQPEGLNATLRPYQHIGYNWLLYMHRQGLGACLADDMGLGKTVQTISLLLRLKESGELGPSLLVGPVVTLPNWEDELKRFAPGLRIRRHTGQSRARSIDDILTPAGGTEALSNDRVDVVLVSYNTLRNDLDIFVQNEWTYVILDEAHYIKNAASQVFKAVRILPSKHRLSLTGTPIENSTMELWSQFSFLNPGLLGSQRKFQSDVASPIEKDGDGLTTDTLRDTIAPFILRRRKQDVLKDLPPKEEILYWTEMAPDQARLYEEHRNLYRDQIAGILNEKGVEASSMDIFRFLLRLRQLAIHPGLASPDDPAYTNASSCKIEALRMLLDESMQEDHKMLIFSQFVSALKVISSDLDKQGRRYALLTGATIDRRAEIERFRNDEDLRIFLLSLKAGGVGINLTNADYVVLFDPWWNPAAERQAVDRAHRIGQNRPVLVYKFITRGTIEEKILELQQRKHKLVGSLLSGEENLISSLSEAEVMNLFN